MMFRCNFHLTLCFLYLHYVEVMCVFMEAHNFTYSLNDTLEEITTGSILQCARRCSHIHECVAVELHDDTDTCVVLKSITEITNETGTHQYRIKPVCAEGWVSYAGSCYMMEDGMSGNWTGCLNLCDVSDAHLLTITSQQEFDFVESNRNGKSIWLGARTIEGENGGVSWIWANGENFEYVNWELGREKYDLNLCLRSFRSVIGWRTKYCEYEHKCICEYHLA